MKEYVLNMGDVVISNDQVKYTCFGLGSCVGLFIYDPVTGVSGGAHILLPDTDTVHTGDSKFYNVDCAIRELFRQTEMYGCAVHSLRAKIVGGANVVGLTVRIGESIVESVLRYLAKYRIPVVGEDIGGTYCRTVRFESKSCLLTVKKPEINQIMIF